MDHLMTKVPYFQANLGAEELEQIERVLKSGWLTTGKVAAEFEARFAEQCSSKHALAVNSCTAALHLALEAIGIGPGDKVIVPTLTFTATAEVIRYLGADPVFVDVDPGTCLITAESIDRQYRLHPEIKACMAVHFGGQSVEMTGSNGVWQKCQELGIYLVQDAAHAFPARDDYGQVGSLGDITCFSFYANKTITTGEGGMLVTNDEAIARRVKTMRLHGIDRDVWDRFTGNSRSWEYDVIAPGYKYNMPDINAAVGVVQLSKAESFRAQRQEIAQRYLDSFATQDKMHVVTSRVKPEHHAWHLFPIVIDAEFSAQRNELIDKLCTERISTSVHYKPLHRMTYYRDRYDLRTEDFPHAERYWKGCVSLPIFPGMAPTQVDAVCQQVKNALETL
jgi:dTDP-4-amino-4,6-dideoxygalactose transaminase